MQALQALIAQYLQARIEAQSAVKQGFDSLVYVAAFDAQIEAFNACLACWMGQTSIKDTVKAFALLSKSRE